MISVYAAAAARLFAATVQEATLTPVPTVSKTYLTSLDFFSVGVHALKVFYNFQLFPAGLIL